MSLGAARSRTLAQLLGLGLCMMACNGADVGFGIALTLDIDTSVSDAALAEITRVHLVGRGDETTDTVITLDRPLARRERLVYRPGLASRSVALHITAEAQSNATLASGDSGFLALEVGNTSSATVTLGTGVQTDGGSDDGSLSGTDGDDVLFAGPSGSLRGEQFEQVLLGFHDVFAADSPDQAIVPSAAADGSLKLRFIGPGGRALGSGTLKGVPFSSMSGADDGASLRRLMGGSGYVDPQVANAATSDHILFLTTDGVHAGLLARVAQ